MTDSKQSAKSRDNLIFGLGFGALILVLVIGLVWTADPSDVRSAPREAMLGDMVKTNSLFFQKGMSEPFTGVIVDEYKSEVTKSRTSIVDGQLQGLSEGWYSTGQSQIAETFVAGVANGPRTKWWENGQKQSEGNVVDGEWEGLFRKWHDNGVLAQEIPMKRGKAHGLARAWFPSGSLKSRVQMNLGEVEKSEYFEDGELTSEVVAQGGL